MIDPAKAKTKAKANTTAASLAEAVLRPIRCFPQRNMYSLTLRNHEKKRPSQEECTRARTEASFGCASSIRCLPASVVVLAVSKEGLSDPAKSRICTELYLHQSDQFISRPIELFSRGCPKPLHQSRIDGILGQREP